jgi:hypothetical protein
MEMKEVIVFELDPNTEIILREEPDISSHHMSITVVTDKHAKDRGLNAISLPILKKDAWDIGRAMMGMGYVPGMHDREELE